jgi:hypothetical protein
VVPFRVHSRAVGGWMDGNLWALESYALTPRARVAGVALKRRGEGTRAGEEGGVSHLTFAVLLFRLLLLANLAFQHFVARVSSAVLPIGRVEGMRGTRERGGGRERVEGARLGEIKENVYDVV